MGRFGHLSLHVEMEHAFGPGRPLFAKPELARLTRSRVAITKKIDVGIRIRRRPVPHEVVEELIPALDPIALHVAHREREGVVDTDDYRLAGLDGRRAELRNLEPGPILRTL